MTTVLAYSVFVKNKKEGLISCLGKARYTGWPKNKPLPYDQNIVLNRVKACKISYIYWSN